MEKILSKDRVKRIRFVERKIQLAVKEMIKQETNPVIKEAYERTLKNLELPLNFYPKDSLSRTIFKIGEHFVSSEILGEHKQKLRIERQGNSVKVMPEGEIIEIPAEHFFYGKSNKVTWKGLHTLIHELCHNPTRNVFEFSSFSI